MVVILWLCLFFGLASGQGVTKCAQPSSPQYGSVVSCTTSVGGVCEFQCNAGYNMLGTGKLSCQSSGSWSGSVPMCLEDDPCVLNPCDSLVSTCINFAPPNFGYACKCLPEYSGEPGTDGKGCQYQFTVNSQNGNAQFKVGAYQSIEFYLGPKKIEIGDLDERMSAAEEATSVLNNGLLEALNATIADLSGQIDEIYDGALADVSAQLGTLSSGIDTNQQALSALKSSMTNGFSFAEEQRSELSTQTANDLSMVRGLQVGIQAQVNADLSNAVVMLQNMITDRHLNATLSISTLLLAIADLQNTRASNAYVNTTFAALGDQINALKNATTVPTPLTSTNTPDSKCTGAYVGLLRYHVSRNVLQICNGTGFNDLAIPEIGQSIGFPGDSCASLKQIKSSSNDGVYWVKVNGSSVQVYCVMNDVFSPHSLGGDGSSTASASLSCRFLKERFSKTASGVYWLMHPTGAYQTYCDMARDGGGWTLVVTAASNQGWSVNNTIFKRTPANMSALLTSDFSALGNMDYIMMEPAVGGTTFEYRLEANVSGHWGGIWKAPRSYSFVSTRNTQIDVALTSQFDSWSYGDSSIEQRMPYIGADCGGILTTSMHPCSTWWGTLVSVSSYKPSPWIDVAMSNPNVIWYWAREGSISLSSAYVSVGTAANPATSCDHVKSTTGSPANGVYVLNRPTPVRVYCAFNSPIVEISGDGLLPTNPALSCRFLADKFRENYPYQGIYYIKNGGGSLPTYCDLNPTYNGWTLLVTAASPSWDTNSVLARNTNSPSLSADFSVLTMADNLKNNDAFSLNSNFQYRIDANALYRWGGIWTAPSTYSFVTTNNGLTSISLNTMFDSWSYNDNGIEARMPYIGATCGILTTSLAYCGSWWGTICSNSGYSPAPWIYPAMTDPGVIWYWVREGPSKY